MDFQLLIFYVKSILENVEVQKLTFWHFLRLWILSLMKSGHSLRADIYPNQNSKPQKLCGNFSMFLSLRFCVKSIFWGSGSSKTDIFAILGALNFVVLVNFSPQEVKRCIKINRASNCGKMADFALLESSKMISRKKWMIQKSWNFHTVWDYDMVKSDFT